MKKNVKSFVFFIYFLFLLTILGGYGVFADNITSSDESIGKIDSVEKIRIIEDELMSSSCYSHSDSNSLTFSNVKVFDKYGNALRTFNSKEFNESVLYEFLHNSDKDSFIEVTYLKFIPDNERAYNDMVNEVRRNTMGSNFKEKYDSSNSVKLYSTARFNLYNHSSGEFVKLYSVYGGYAIKNSNVRVTNQTIRYGCNGIVMPGYGMVATESQVITKYDNIKFWTYYAPSSWKPVKVEFGDFGGICGVNHTVKMKRNNHTWSETLENNY